MIYAVTDQNNNPTDVFYKEINDDIVSYHEGIGHKIVKAKSYTYEKTGNLVSHDEDYDGPTEYKKVPVLIHFTQQEEREMMEVTRFQAKAALHNNGYLQQVKDIMADSTTSDLTVMAWEDAQTFKRLSPVILDIASQLGLTDTQMDSLFEEAANITS